MVTVRLRAGALRFRCSSFGAAGAAVALLLGWAPAALAQHCPADLDRDGVVGNGDFAHMLDAWGKCAGCDADLDGDGAVDGADLTRLVESWGPCRGPSDEASTFWEHDDGSVVFDGRKFRSWQDYLANTDPEIWRCGTLPGIAGGGAGAGAGAGPDGDGGVAAAAGDCDFDTTVPRIEYQPYSTTTQYCIPVVVHVIRNASGSLGDISIPRILEQISILNARFAAARIRFQIATIDPNGESTLGIRFYNDDTWYNDQGAYWNTLAWDPAHYLNIYTNTASGKLGVATPPWFYSTPNPEDRVVINWRNFGVDPLAAPYGLGMTAVHEVGHYLGLYHTHDKNQDLDGDGKSDGSEGVDGCAAGCCYASGDLCCDTNRESSPHFGCLPAPSTCDAGPDPVQNYMDYSDDACMTHFTREQIGRMRCTLMTRRASLPGACTVQGDLDGDGTVDGADLSILLGVWGACQPGDPCPADLNEDGIVNAQDLAFLFGAWPTGSLPARVVPGWATLIEAEPDPAVVTNPALRNAILATGLAWRVRDGLTDIEMVLIPPGTFSMGCSPSSQGVCSFDENPVHSVTLTCPFYMGRYEVTQAQWTAWMGSNPSFFQSESAQVPAGQVPNRPVERVSWNMIAGANGFISGTGMRLPTEAEWEYAYRAGTTTGFHGWPAQAAGTNDDALAGNIAWQQLNSSSQTRPVGGKAANGFGLHDMAGNVFEWVSDWWSGSYYASSPAKNPTGPATGAYRVLRGGGYVSVTGSVRSSYRSNATPGTTAGSVGFRIARNP